MDRTTLLEHLHLDPADPAVQAIDRRSAAGNARVPADWRWLAAAAARVLQPGPLPAGTQRPWPAWNETPAPLVLGVAGAQGSGKTTLAAQLERTLAAAGASVAACSLDDFYLSRARRNELAAAVHPLLATRGVPGTHDVAHLESVIQALGRPGTVAVPRFDKAADDPLPPARWRQVQAPVDVLVLEGWCLGAEPEEPGTLQAPVNALEAEEDADGHWRRYVNDALAGPYAALWQRLHGLIFLQVPDLRAVLRWRTEQEQALPRTRRMNEAQLRRFIAHYERVTRAMLTTLPRRAQWVAGLDDAAPAWRLCG
ncbi:MAG: kinase [Gammaproteobacteria bacterium]|nr:kinase [Gammaproteobacteria bacterium]